jgi:Uma2 family endonuclease
MSLLTPGTPAPVPEVEYPASDGEPMAETPLHVRAIMLLFQALEDCLAYLPDVYIGANMFWYWEQGNPNARRAPDVMVIKGVARAARRSFFSWLENGTVPSVIFEITSEKTWRQDLFEKRRLYAELGVREYFLFDPEGTRLRPVLQGFRLKAQGHYVPLEPDDLDRLRSEELCLYVVAEGPLVRLFDGTTGEAVLFREERAELERYRAENERHRADAARQRVEAERQRAEFLEAEIARLKSLLEQARGGGAPGGRAE